MILKVVVVPKWIGLKTMEDATKQQLGMILKMDQIWQGMAVTEVSQQVHPATFHTLQMALMWTLQ